MSQPLPLMPNHASPGAPLASLVMEIENMLREISPVHYIENPAGRFTSTIGEQVRHILDHIRIFLDGLREGRIDYDGRPRGTTLEHDRNEALRLCCDLRERLMGLPVEEISKPVVAHLMLESTMEPVPLASTAGRELGFLISHTVHHNALLALMLQELGRPLPRRFGYAPATIAHKDRA